MLEWFRKAFTRMVHGGGGWFFSLLPRTKYNYAREVGKGYGSSVVMAPVKFIQRVFPEAPLRIRRKADRDKVLEDHDLVELIRKPNRFYSGNALWRATIAAYILEGNAYWLKVRNRIGTPVEIWWIPQWLIEPKWPQDGSEFISHYEYRPMGGETVDIPVSEVVHFRNGLDPRNPRLGMSDLHSVLREVFSDDEASNFVASVLRNMGVPGIIISPKTGTVSADEARNAERVITRKFGGDKRGGALAMQAPTDVHQFAWSPAQLELASTRDVSEERVCAVLGTPAAVVGFGSGLQQTKVGATMRELVQLAWVSAVTPMQTAMAGDLESQMLTDFTASPHLFEVYFDKAEVDALQENELERARRIDIGVRGKWIKRSEARRAFHYPVSDEDDTYIDSPAKPDPEPADPEQLPAEDEDEDEAIPA